MKYFLAGVALLSMAMGLFFAVNLDAANKELKELRSPHGVRPSNPKLETISVPNTGVYNYSPNHPHEWIRTVSATDLPSYQVEVFTLNGLQWFAVARTSLGGISICPCPDPK